MRFLLSIHEQEKRWSKLSESQQNSETQEYGAFAQEFAKAIRGGNALQPTPTAKPLRVCNGKHQVTDGPFAETKEQLGDTALGEANNSDEEIAIAAKIPWATWIDRSPADHDIFLAVRCRFF